MKVSVVARGICFGMGRCGFAAWMGVLLLTVCLLAAGCDQKAIDTLLDVEKKVPAPTVEPAAPVVPLKVAAPAVPPSPEMEAKYVIDEFFRQTPDLVTDESLEKLAGIHEPARGEIVTLSLQTSKVTEKGLAALKAFPHLKSLNLAFLGSLTKRGLESVTSLSDLEMLNLGQTPASNEMVEVLAGNASLKKLYLNGTRVTDEILPVLAQLPNLEHLSMADISGIDGSGFKTAKGFVKLKSLSVNHTGIVDQAVPLLAKFPIEGLSMAGCPGLTDQGIVKLTGMKELKNLDVRDNNQLTIKGFSKLAGLPKLWSLSVSENRGFDDQTLKAFQKSKSLRFITLEGSAVTDQGRRALSKSNPEIKFESPRDVP